MDDVRGPHRAYCRDKSNRSIGTTRAATKDRRDVIEEVAMGMARRRTRRRTMMVAGGIAHERGRREAEAEMSDSQAYAAPPPPAPPAPAPTAVDPAAEIEKLASLHDSGALTDEEFAAAKQNILGL